MWFYCDGKCQILTANFTNLAIFYFWDLCYLQFVWHLCSVVFIHAVYIPWLQCEWVEGKGRTNYVRCTVNFWEHESNLKDLTNEEGKVVSGEESNEM